jgi:heterodisulfide reductase subunit C1
MDLLQYLVNDIRYTEGLNACMNCGICTAICPAAEFYEYDPRSIITVVQSGDEPQIRELLEGDTIWLCGQCMSCKTRCPRGNCPGLIISVLRKISQVTGAFIQSAKGRQQYLLEQNIGGNILHFGYCIHPSVVVPEKHPEQGPVWKWIYHHKAEVYAVAGANLDREGPGALRKINEKVLNELAEIFEVTGGIDLFDRIEYYSKAKAKDLGFKDRANNVDMEAYSHYIDNQ